MQQMIEQIKEALLETTGNGEWNIGKQSPNGLQNIGFKGSMICQTFTKEDAHLISNAPEWIRYLIGEVERLQKALNEISKIRPNPCAWSEEEYYEKLVECEDIACKALEIGET